MTENNAHTRRTVIGGTLAVGTAITLAGCSAIVDNFGGRRTAEGDDIAYGDTVTGEITDDSPSDPEYSDLAEPYTFQGSAGDVVTVTMSSETFDTYLLMSGPGGDVIQENDDSRHGTDSRLVRGLPADGAYTVWASSLSGTATGEFTLSLATGSRRDLVPEGATELSIGDTVEGQLTTESPTDPFFSDPGVPYTFEGSEGESLTVSMESAAVDPFLLVTDSNGNLIARDDDGGSGVGSQLTTTLPADGTYVIWAESALGDETGSFTLSVE